MKLLLDENLAPRLCDDAADLYPGSLHVRAVGLLGAADEAVWAFALNNGFAIASKHSDFQQRAVLRGLRRSSSGSGWGMARPRTSRGSSASQLSACEKDLDAAVLILD